MNKYEKQIVNLFLDDPETDEQLLIISSITNNEDGTYSFIVANKNKSSIWKHTIKTEELIESR